MKVFIILLLPAIFLLADSLPSQIVTVSNNDQAISNMQPPTSEGLTVEVRHRFSKAHAILMLFAWLCFVPTAFLFARLGRDLYADQRIYGVAVWFQFHRAANFIGVVCMVASILCIFISLNWKWAGIGSDKKVWTQVHTMTGLISVVLAVIQPFGSLLRCGPDHPKRPLFNWAHRIIGVLSYALALTAIIVAAIHFQKIWNEPVLEIVLCSLPIVFCTALSIGFHFIEKRDKCDQCYGPSPLRAPLVFWSSGVFFAVAMALSFLVANGYKPKA